MKVKITKVVNGSAMRTPSIVGKLAQTPTEGEPVIVISKGLDVEGSVRLFQTSPARKIRALPVSSEAEITAQEDKVLIETENSTYLLEFLIEGN